MIRAETAFDSNIILYVVSSDHAKADVAEALLKAGGIVSVQVLNEVASVSRRKFRMAWVEIHELLEAVRSSCTTVDITAATHERALGIAQRFGFQVYDSVVIAAALEVGCATLLSEDLQNGQKIDSLTIKNPFATG